MGEICFRHVQFENILRNSNIVFYAMVKVTFLTPISIEDEEIIIKINSIKNYSMIDEACFINFFYKEPIICVILPLHEWYGDIYNFLRD